MGHRTTLNFRTMDDGNGPGPITDAFYNHWAADPAFALRYAAEFIAHCQRHQLWPDAAAYEAWAAAHANRWERIDPAAISDDPSDHEARYTVWVERGETRISDEGASTVATILLRPVVAVELPVADGRGKRWEVDAIHTGADSITAAATAAVDRMNDRIARRVRANPYGHGWLGLEDVELVDTDDDGAEVVWEGRTLFAGPRTEAEQVAESLSA